MKKNPKQGYYLGIDTSAYTSSLAIVDREEHLVFEERKTLPVEEGSLGLRQSEAVFAHLNQLPFLINKEELIPQKGKIIAVAAATAPRPVEGSYMPVFKVSEAFGLFLAKTMGLNFLPSTHQEGHVMAGLWSAGLPSGRYLVTHLSGGTTEIIFAVESSPGCLDLTMLGGSCDLNAGQFIDRFGKQAGLDFPAGPALEKLAQNSIDANLELPLAVKGSEISFSGPASHAERLLAKGFRKEDLARAVEKCITDSLVKAVTALKHGINSYNGILAVGGVTANQFIRKRLSAKLPGQKIFFAAPEYAADNAAGLAVQAARFFKE